MRCRQTHRRGTRNHFGPNTTSRQAKPPGQIVPLHPFSRRTFVASTAAVFAAPVEYRFAAGFVIPAERPGKPKIFMSHGRQDPILPIERCSRAIAPELKAQGYDVRFDEFEGGHRMPEILPAAAEWRRKP